MKTLEERIDFLIYTHIKKFNETRERLDVFERDTPRGALYKKAGVREIRGTMNIHKEIIAVLQGLLKKHSAMEDLVKLQEVTS